MSICWVFCKVQRLQRETNYTRSLLLGSRIYGCMLFLKSHSCTGGTRFQICHLEAIQGLWGGGRWSRTLRPPRRSSNGGLKELQKVEVGESLGPVGLALQSHDVPCLLRGDGKGHRHLGRQWAWTQGPEESVVLECLLFPNRVINHSRHLRFHLQWLRQWLPGC